MILNMNEAKKKVLILGAGFTGLAAAYELINAGFEVEIIEKDSDIGGLAGTFQVSKGIKLEKFYHHWFSSDTEILKLIDQLGLSSKIKFLPTNTGLFFANSIFRLASPLDLLKFKPLPFLDRIRTGMMALYARKTSVWINLENIYATDWIRNLGGEKSLEVIWKPLLQGKFGDEAKNISAVWFWNKLKLRGSSRNKKGAEELAYFTGGFGALTESIKEVLIQKGVKFHLNTAVQEIKSLNNSVVEVNTEKGSFKADYYLATLPLPIFLKSTPSLPDTFTEKASQIRFLGNVCLVLRLKKSLSETYWLNVADPTFPFVGIIEHTNFDDKENYNGERIAYVSKYLSTEDTLYKLTKEEFFEYSLPYIRKIFPEFDRDWVIGYETWKAEYSQPIIVKNYSKMIPPTKTPIENLYLSTMAQIYPEDRGTNYAVRHGKMVANQIITEYNESLEE